MLALNNYANDLVADSHPSVLFIRVNCRR